VIGGAGAATTFNGTIIGSAERAVVDVTGGGSLTLTNGANTYTAGTSSATAYAIAGTTILGNGQEPLAGNTFTQFLTANASNGGGQLFVSNTTGSATGASPVYVEGASVNSNWYANGGLLGGDGIIAGTVHTVVNSSIDGTIDSASPLANFAAGPTIDPGAAGGNTSNTLSLTGGLQLGDWTNLDFTIDVNPGDALDSLIAVTNTTNISGTNSLVMPSDGGINVNFTFPNGSPQLFTWYTLITYTGSDSGGSGLVNWAGNGYGAAAPVFQDTGAGAIQVEFVPEPASIGLLSLGALGLLRRRRASK